MQSRTSTWFAKQGFLLLSCCVFCVTFDAVKSFSKVDGTTEKNNPSCMGKQ